MRTKLIAVSETTYDTLKSLGLKGQSFDDILRELLNKTKPVRRVLEVTP